MKCNRAAGTCTFLVQFALVLVLFLGASPAFAQISFDDEATHKEELKYSLQEAKEVESVYKETHLNLEHRNFKRGEAARKRVKVKGSRKIDKFYGPGSAISRSKRTKTIKHGNKGKP